MSSTETFVDAILATASELIGQKVELVSTTGDGSAGGGGASTSSLLNKEKNTKYFLKFACGELDMLHAKNEGLKAMSKTGTIQVPTGYPNCLCW
jgi:fructosamine-3-kinase